MRPEDRERIQAEVVSRVVTDHARKATAAADGYLETLINDTLYYERQRLEQQDHRKVKGELDFYEAIHHRMIHGTEHDLPELVQTLARRFAAEIVGNFDERVYRLSTRAIPPGLWALLCAMSPKRLLSWEGIRHGLATRFRVQGEVAHVRALANRGTLVVLPTHSSNLDSIVIGYATYLLGLPPLTYGAGLNLFTNPLISFFMNHLGAYKVDRKKTCMLYKDVLKEYATCALEMGYHNLFFPGGGRSRSGAMEQKLKKGLLGAALKAYINNLQQGRPKPNLYVIPCTLSSTLVLEAETLIGDYLTAAGKSRYVIEDDEFSRPRKIYKFVTDLMALDATLVVTCGAPLDIFGNRVDREGTSLDARGRAIDISRYVVRNGEPRHDPQRDAEYTHELAAEIARAYLRDNVLLCTHLVAFALFSLLRRHNPQLDLYRLLRTGGERASFPLKEVCGEVDRLLRLLRARPEEQGPRLDSTLVGNDAQTIVADALRAFGLYHSRRAALRQGDRVFHEDRSLLLYYGNRLQGYDLGE